MLTASVVSSSLLEISAVTPAAWSPVVMVVSEPAGVHCTASVVPAFWPFTVTCAVPAKSMPGASLKSGIPDEHPATTSVAAAAATHRILTVQHLRRGRAEYSSSERLVGAVLQR